MHLDEFLCNASAATFAIRPRGPGILAETG